MVSRSRQYESTIAVICQAALRYKRHNISSWFLRTLLLDGYNCQIHTFHFPAGIRFSQEEFCRSSGEYRLQAKSIRESCSLIAEEIIAVPNPSSEGATSTFFPSHDSRSAERFLWMQDWIIVADIIIAAEILLPVILTTSGRRGNRYLRIGGMLSIPQYLDCSRTRI